MNDFTKDELEELLDAIGWKLGEGQADKLTFPLEAKLKAMIENYPKQIDGFMRDMQDYTGCNHDWHELEMAEPATPTIICIRCRAIHFIRIK